MFESEVQSTDTQKLIQAIYILARMWLQQETDKQKESKQEEMNKESMLSARFSTALLHDSKKQRRLNLI